MYSNQSKATASSARDAGRDQQSPRRREMTSWPPRGIQRTGSFPQTDQDRVEVAAIAWQRVTARMASEWKPMAETLRRRRHARRTQSSHCSPPFAAARPAPSMSCSACCIPDLRQLAHAPAAPKWTPDIARHHRPGARGLPAPVQGRIAGSRRPEAGGRVPIRARIAHRLRGSGTSWTSTDCAASRRRRLTSTTTAPIRSSRSSSTTSRSTSARR